MSILTCLYLATCFFRMTPTPIKIKILELLQPDQSSIETTTANNSGDDFQDSHVQ